MSLILCVFAVCIDFVSAGLSVNQPKFCASATWRSEGVTFANATSIGSHPGNVFVTVNDSIYVAARERHVISLWRHANASLPVNISDGVVFPVGLFVRSNGDVYVGSNVSHGQISRWLFSNVSNTSTWNASGFCFGLFLDIHDTLYCSIPDQHVVLKGSIENASSLTIPAAGDGIPQLSAGSLERPHGIFVDVGRALYVADCGNDRIQTFRFDQLNGTTMAGQGANDTLTLLCPTGVILDADGYLFVADSGHHRIIGSGPHGYRCIVGCTMISGSAVDQLDFPWSLAFDSHGSLFVSDRGNDRIQTFTLARNACGPSYNRPKLCLDATWHANATTIAYENITSAIASGLFVDINNTIYVGDRQGRRIWYASETNLTSWRSVSDDLRSPMTVYVTLDRDIYVDNGAYRSRVDRWVANATNSTVAMYFNGSCHGLFIDIDDNLYCSVPAQDKVVKKRFSDDLNSSIVVAGTGVIGSASHELYNPQGIFVDLEQNLYVADCGNDRIQFFRAGEVNGTTLFGRRMNSNPKFNCPYGIVLDMDGNLFVTVYYNNSVFRLGPNGMECVFACTSTNGSNANQLQTPRALAFDTHGNILIADGHNSRIQKVLLATNSCDFTTTELPATTSLVQTSSIETTRTYSATLSVEFQTTLLAATTGTQSDSTMATTMDFGSTTTMAQTSSLTPMTTTIAQSEPHTTTTLSQTSVSTAATAQSKSHVTTTQIETMSSSTAQHALPSSVSPSSIASLTSTASNSLCNSLNPCYHAGVCHYSNLTPQGYACSCPSGYRGVQCELDIRLCKPSITCWNNGTCQEITNTTFHCTCAPGWEGVHCETQINYCRNVACLNNGVCQPSLMNYTCACLGMSYSGRHCEITSTEVAVRQAVAKSFAFVAITAVVCLLTFIVGLDLAKFVFGIDPVENERRRRRQKPTKRTKQPQFAMHYIYVLAPLQHNSLAEIAQ